MRVSEQPKGIRSEEEYALISTIEQAKTLIREKNIEMVDFKMTDIDGRWRHITIPARRFDESTMTSGIGFDGSNYGFAPVENSDMVFIPDLSTAAVDPFARRPTLTMSGDAMVIARPRNVPFDQYPRSVVKRAAQYLRETGIADEMIIGPEFEFYLFDDVYFETGPGCVRCEVNAGEAAWNSGHAGDGSQIPHKGGYHIDIPHDSGSDLRSTMCRLLEDWGVRVKYHHHEVGGPGQQEIEVELADVVTMADSTMAAKYIIRNAAAQEGRTATFMPKPIWGEAGSGLHVHMLLTKGGEPLFYDENGYAQLSQTAHYFMGGLLRHAKSLCGITNPSTNSYRRLVPGFEAPVTIGYATANRSAVIRIPAYAKTPLTKRFELRNPDATCNPYYAYAAILMAGLDGIENRIDPAAGGWGPYDCNLFDLPEAEKAKIDSLPASLEEALEELERDHGYLTRGGVFPERLLAQWIARKRAEASEIQRIPHPAEFTHYYDL
jgi:glutamine synthetase